MNKHQKSVTVIGAGFTGLVSALICAQKGMNVTIIEKRDLDKTPVSQGRHAHMLTKKGLNILLDLFPNIEADYLAKRFVKLHFTQEVKWVGPYQEYPRFHSEFGDIYTFYRPDLDQVLLDMLKLYPNAKLLSGVEVTEIHRKHTHIDKISTSKGDFYSDLFLMTSGRYGNSDKNLECLNIQKCEKESIPSLLKYRSFEIESDYFHHKDYKAIMATTFGDINPNGTVLIPVKERRFMVTQVGQDLSQDVHAFARLLHTQEISKVLENSQIVTAPTTYKLEGSRKYNFKKVKNWPEGLLMLGDAAVFMNPIFAQGLTLALMQCEALGHYLDGDKSCFSFQQQIDDIIQEPWFLGTIEDRRLNAKMWQRPFYSMAEKYVAQVLKQATYDKKTYLKLVKTLNMLSSPMTFFNFKGL